MRKWLALGLAAVFAVSVVPLPVLAQQKKEIKPTRLPALEPGGAAGPVV